MDHWMTRVLSKRSSLVWSWLDLANHLHINLPRFEETPAMVKIIRKLCMEPYIYIFFRIKVVIMHGLLENHLYPHLLLHHKMLHQRSWHSPLLCKVRSNTSSPWQTSRDPARLSNPSVVNLLIKFEIFI